MERVLMYDTTLRDGVQQEGLNLSVSDKVAILSLLDGLGVDFVEGGWPGAIPKDSEFFDLARTLPLAHTRLVAFGATVKTGGDPATDPQVQALRHSGAQIVTLVAKSDIRHVEQALRTTGEENLRMVTDTVQHLRGAGIDVMVDLEHYFDGRRVASLYATEVALRAAQAGASTVICCDTNGGTLPSEVSAGVAALRDTLDEGGYGDVVIGIHAHNDAGCAVASSLAAVEAGARHVQGTVNGYGERTGNANLLTCAANLELKMGYRSLPEGALSRITEVSHQVAEIVNISAFTREAYVGASAFAHKAGLHASAIRVSPDLYQHIDPLKVGNGMRMLISEMAGRASVELKARENGIDLTDFPEVSEKLTAVVKQREALGYTYDAADASFALLLLDVIGQLPRYVRVESWKVTAQEIAEVQGEPFTQSEATIKVHSDRRHIRTAEGNGPVNALDRALRHVLTTAYPEARTFSLSDFKVRIVDERRSGTDAIIRVLINMTDGRHTWTTVGIGTDIIEASWEALFDGYWWGLYQAGVETLLEDAQQVMRE